MNRTLRSFLFLLPVLYMILVWFLSGKPDNIIVELKSSKIDHYFKESMHLIEFAILYLLIALALKVNGKLTPSVHLASALFACLYGITDEIHQSFVPYRDASIFDVVKDCIGVFVAFFIVKRKSRKKA